MSPKTRERRRTRRSHLSCSSIVNTRFTECVTLTHTEFYKHYSVNVHVGFDWCACTDVHSNRLFLWKWTHINFARNNEISYKHKSGVNAVKCVLSRIAGGSVEVMNARVIDEVNVTGGLLIILSSVGISLFRVSRFNRSKQDTPTPCTSTLFMVSDLRKDLM